MKKITLYCYARQDGGITVSTVKPDVEYTEKFRLIAEKNKMLTKDGEVLYYCVDVDSADKWYEVDEPEDEIMEVER